MKNLIKLILVFLILESAQVCLASRIYLPMDTVIKYSPAIVEGKVIAVTPAYWAGGMIYTSYIIQVLKLFKGNLNNEYIEIPLAGGRVGNESLYIPSCGTLDLPGKGQIAILFLNLPNPADSTANKKFLSSGDTIANNCIVNPYYDALSYNGFKNVEREVYRHIEGLTKQKRRIISRPEVDDPEIRNWLNQNNNKKLLNKAGLSLYISYAELSYEKETFDVWIDVKSATGYTDLHSLEFAVTYNTKVFGNFVVKNKKIKFNTPSPYYSKKRATIPAILLGDSAYETTITDLDSATILISIQSVNTDKSLYQISKNLIALLSFNVQNFSPGVGISFPADKAKGKYYDYEHTKISSLGYIFCGAGLDVTPKSFFPPIVSAFSPDTIQCGEKEILTITGKNFLSDKTQVLIWCTKKPCGFYAIIPSAEFLTLTDTEITLYIPCELNVGGSACGDMFPTRSGFIVGKNGLNVDFESPKKLIIINSN